MHHTPAWHRVGSNRFFQAPDLYHTSRDRSRHLARLPASARDQTVVFNRLDLYYKPPDSGMRQYKSRSRRPQFDPPLGAAPGLCKGPNCDLQLLDLCCRSPESGGVWSQRGSKLSFSIALICTTSHRIPAGAGTNEGPETGDLMRVRRAGSGQPGAERQPHRGRKSSFSIALNCATSRRIPAGKSTNEGPDEGDLMRVRRAGSGQPGDEQRGVTRSTCSGVRCMLQRVGRRSCSVRFVTESN